MKKLAPFIGGAIIGGFTLLVAVIVISLSFQALGRIFPDSLLDQVVGLVLFDLAAFCWFYAFVYLSASSMQYVWAAFGFLFGLGGAIALIAIEVGISSGMVAADAMTKPLTYTFITAAIAHLVLLYLRHASAPEVSARISLGVEKAKIQDEGMRQAENHLDIARAQLGATISARLLGDVLRDLNMDTPDIIDAKALPVDDSLFIPRNGYPTPKREVETGFFDRLKEAVSEVNPFNKQKKSSASASQPAAPPAQFGNNQVVWTTNQLTGQKQKVFCLICRDMGKPDWASPNQCEHIGETGEPVSIESVHKDWTSNIPSPVQTQEPAPADASTASAVG